MKNYFLLLITVLLISFAPQTVSAQWYSSDTTIIDVRTAGEFEDGHLKKALNIPYGIISKEISSHVQDKDAPIMVYCRSGRRSGIAKFILEKNGYSNVTNGGAFSDLQPLEP